MSEATGIEERPVRTYRRPLRNDWWLRRPSYFLYMVRESTVIFGWRMPWRSNAIEDHLPKTSRGLRGVVFIHGYICNRGLWNPWMKRLLKLDRAFVAEGTFATLRRLRSLTGHSLTLRSTRLRAPYSRAVYFPPLSAPPPPPDVTTRRQPAMFAR